MKPAKKTTFAADEVADYVVCPESWRLKYLDRAEREYSERSTHAGEIRREWSRNQDLSASLKAYAKIVYLLLVGLVIVVFLLEQERSAGKKKHSGGRKAQIEGTAE